MKTAIAEQDWTFTVNCPHCDNTIFSDHTDDWDVHEMVHYDQKIKCDECEKEFMVSLS